MTPPTATSASAAGTAGVRTGLASNAARPDAQALPRELTEFLVEFAIALHKHSMYPSGHQALGPAAETVLRRAARILADRNRIAFGAARTQLIIDGVATDPDHPVLRRLAERLHRHNLGAISLARGLEIPEVTGALEALARDPERDGALGLAGDAMPAWQHLKLHPLTFDRLTLVSDAPIVTAGGAGPTGGPGGRDSRGAELWIGLARAAMIRDAAGAPPEVVPTEPAVVARAIDEHPGADAYDQVIVGYLLQIAQELKGPAAADTTALRERTGRLIGALKPETLRRLIQMGGDSTQRGAFVLDATHGMAVDAVLEIVKAAAVAGGQTISHGLLRMLSKLAAHAEQGVAQARPAADSALREEVTRLVSGWHLADPNPAAYSQLLQNIATAAPARAALKDDGGNPHQRDPLRVVQMSLEIGASGPLVERAVDRLVATGGTGELLKLLDSASKTAALAADAVRARLLRPDTIASLAGHDPLDFETLDCLLPLLPLEAYPPLLETLAAASNRTTRRKLLDRLAAVEIDIDPLIARTLEDDRWYVVRNMLVLLQRRGRPPEGFSALPWVTHADARVRHAALRLQLTLPAERQAALSATLSDDDPRLVRVGLLALQQECPAGVLEPVAALAENGAQDEELRVLAVRALGRSAEPRALEALLKLVDGGRTLLGRQRIAARTRVTLAAIESLAGGWVANPRAASILDAAARSSDAGVRRAATGGAS